MLKANRHTQKKFQTVFVKLGFFLLARNTYTHSHKIIWREEKKLSQTINTERKLSRWFVTFESLFQPKKKKNKEHIVLVWVERIILWGSHSNTASRRKKHLSPHLTTYVCAYVRFVYSYRVDTYVKKVWNRLGQTGPQWSANPKWFGKILL